MLLSSQDKARFKILYNDYTHKELSKVFSTNIADIIATAKGLGIYVPYNRTPSHGRKDIENVEIEENTTP